MVSREWQTGSAEYSFSIALRWRLVLARFSSSRPVAPESRATVPHLKVKVIDWCVSWGIYGPNGKLGGGFGLCNAGSALGLSLSVSTETVS